MCLGLSQFLCWRLLLLGCGFDWLVALVVFFHASLSGGSEQLVSIYNCLVTRSFLISKLGCLLELIIALLLFFAFDHGRLSLRSGCDHDRIGDFLRHGLGKWLCFARFTALDDFSLSDHGMLVHVHGILTIPRRLFAFFLFGVLAHVFGEGPWSFFISLHFGRVIMALWHRVDHLLHVVVLLLPSAYVRVHILHERAWRCSLHLVGWYR